MLNAKKANFTLICSLNNMYVKLSNTIDNVNENVIDSIRRTAVINVKMSNCTLNYTGNNL